MTLSVSSRKVGQQTKHALQIRQQRRRKAWRIARTAAALLKSKYHATRVVVFGSLTDKDRFSLWSDLDLAVWGVTPGDYFDAVAKVLDIGGEIKTDLILAEKCKPPLREVIEMGKEL